MTTPKPAHSGNAASPPRMTADDLGAHYIRDDGSIWVLITYAEHPTASLERLERVGEHVHACRSQRVGGVVGAPIFAGFRKLVPEDGDA